MSRASGMRRITVVGLLLAMALVASPSAAAQERIAAAVPAEYQVKAVFLFNFLQFAEWPPNAFPTADAPITIGVLGDDPFGAALEETIRGERIAGRRIEIRRGKRIEELKGCQLLFICRSEQARLPEILRQLRSTPVLTVSDIDGFAQAGGMIELYIERNRIRFAVDPSRAQRQGLKLSSQLLRLGMTRAGNQTTGDSR